MEVVSGFVFEPVRTLKVAHFGLFWTRIFDEFPETQHAVPLGLEDTLARDVAGGMFFSPRLWFINRNQDQLIQVQHDRFYFNWREGPNRSKYSTYGEIFERFIHYWHQYEIFLEVARLDRPVLRECELTYINHIPQDVGWTSMLDVSNVLPRLAWKANEAKFLPAPRALNWNAVFDLPDDKGRLTVKLQPAFRGKKKEPIVVLELTAKGLGNDKSEKGIGSWFETAHEWIVKAFEDLTSTEIQQRVWGKEQ